MESPSSNPSRIKLQVVIATETSEGQVHGLRKFLHITQKENDITSFITEVNDKFRNLYPSERPITILRVQDGDGCDLDPGYQLYDVFEERSIVKVIIADDGPSHKRLFSPAGSKLALLHERLRRDSFDSVTGYATPSASDLHASPSMYQRQHGGPNGVTGANGSHGNGELTDDALQGMQAEHERSPELGSDLDRVDSTTSATGRKRKRSDQMEIPASPEKKRRDLGDTEKVIPDSQASVVPETQRPQTSVIPGTQKPRRKSSAAKGKENLNISAMTSIPVAEEMIEGNKEMEIDQPPPKKPVSRGIKKAIRGKPPVQNATNRHITPELAIIKQTPLNTPQFPQPSDAATKFDIKNSPPPAIRKSQSPVIEKPRLSNDIKVGRKRNIGKSPTPQSSATSGPSSSGSDDNEPDSSRTSRSHSSSDSASDSESDSDGSSKSDSEGGEKMEIDSVRKSPDVVPKRSISPVKKETGKEGVTWSVSRSASPSSSSSSDSDSDSDSNSDSDSKASDSEAHESGSESAASDSERDSSCDSDSDSDSDSLASSSSNSSSRSSSKSRSASPKSRSASPPNRTLSRSPSINSTKSKEDETGSSASTSSSSRAVAVALGGSTSRNPILHRIILSQETDRSPQNLSLSQQSPLASAGGGLLSRWKSLSDIRGMMAQSSKVEKAPVKPAESESDESDDSESSSDDSSSESGDSDEETGGVPKSKLAGRVNGKRKRKGESLSKMFS